MADWKEMYLKMFRASEEAIRILEAAQRECEEMYMRDGDPERDGEDERVWEEDNRDEADEPDNAPA